MQYTNCHHAPMVQLPQPTWHHDMSLLQPPPSLRHPDSAHVWCRLKAEQGVRLAGGAPPYPDALLPLTSSVTGKKRVLTSEEITSMPTEQFQKLWAVGVSLLHALSCVYHTLQPVKSTIPCSFDWIERHYAE